MKLIHIIPFFLVLTGLGACVTTTVTKPDGTVVKTSSQDPNVVAAISSGVTQGAILALQSQINHNGREGK